ncbi:hypothetical protein QBC33DRAFT_581664 [Phialemonium atrogriseum]|uniref:Uncharacterized protein n=1 Tax=Phialemonium atrogriseum TaxID=1093897 RepID=A0AAJ0FGN1_9PEZI|nr:uncharacterized protein QBC33DRAFT_581664 [Phialemonium atrogriseum]KAK1762523.1 hypothetical protein QBC33DRAFT_581664 [Phialemonium atrogriseum]
MADYDVRGKIALVTGAGPGISLALAQRLLEADCSVMIADLALRPEAEATVAKYPNPPPADASGRPSAAFHKTDVANWTQLNALWEAALKTFGRVDIVVNGASIFEPPWSSYWNPPGVSPSPRDPTDAAVGAYRIFSNRHVKGNLLWVSSMGAYVHSIQTPLYFASKAAIVSVFKSLQGLRDLVGIRNSAVCPGPTRTPLFDQEFCRDRLGQDDLALAPADVADVMMRLLTEEQYGDGNILEVMMIGTKERPEVHLKEVQLDALYPTVSPMGGNTKAMEEELKFMQLVAQKGMRST